MVIPVTASQSAVDNRVAAVLLISPFILYLLLRSILFSALSALLFPLQCCM